MRNGLVLVLVDEPPVTKPRREDKGRTYSRPLPLFAMVWSAV
jgi:hypothetical protein